jgi:hypothetical protein
MFEVEAVAAVDPGRLTLPRMAEGRLRLDHLPAARRNHTNPSPQNASVTRKPTPLPGKRQTCAARLRPIARPASARALLSP